MTTSTRINSSSVHTYIFVCFIRNYYIGLLANNATWCQNRGYICISSTRRTYGRIHAVSCIHPVIQTSTINSANRIISKGKEKEDPRRDSSKTSFQLESKSVSSVSTRSPVTTTTSLILHTELILPQENYNNYKAHPVQIVRRHPPAVAPRVSKHSTRQKQGSKRPTVVHSSPGPYSSSRLPVNSTRQKQHSTRQPAFTQPFHRLPGAIHLICKEST